MNQLPNTTASMDSSISPSWRKNISRSGKRLFRQQKNAQTHQSRQDVERTTGCRVLHLPNNRHQSRNATNPLPPLGTSPHRPADQRLITQQKTKTSTRNKKKIELYIFKYIIYLFIVYYVFHFAFTTFFGKEDNYHLYSYLQKKKSVPQSVRQNDRFFHSKQSLRILPTKALYISGRSSIKHKQSIRFIS